MGTKRLKFLLIFLAISLILGKRGLLDTAKSRCKSVEKSKIVR